MPAALVRRVLEGASDDVVLVGGQALAFWMDRFGVAQPPDLPAVSRDVDFFTRDPANAAPLRQFAQAIHGQVEVLPPEAISALIGSAIAPAGDDAVYNVDLLHALVGLQREEVERNAVVATLPGVEQALKVMHPLHVLQSRNANLHTLEQKQDAIGQLQLRLAIEVARRFLESEMDRLDLSDPQARERAVLDLVHVVIDLSAESAATKNAERYGIHVADAIPAWRIRSRPFWAKQWRHLRQQMSPGHAMLCEQRKPDGA